MQSKFAFLYKIQFNLGKIYIIKATETAKS